MLSCQCKKWQAKKEKNSLKQSEQTEIWFAKSGIWKCIEPKCVHIPIKNTTLVCLRSVFCFPVDVRLWWISEWARGGEGEIARGGRAPAATNVSWSLEGRSEVNLVLSWFTFFSTRAYNVQVLLETGRGLITVS